jgi:hypothetical protein
MTDRGRAGWRIGADVVTAAVDLRQAENAIATGTEARGSQDERDPHCGR